MSIWKKIKFNELKNNKKVLYSIVGSTFALSMVIAITVPVALSSQIQNNISANNQAFDDLEFNSSYEPYNNLFNFNSLKNKKVSEIDKSIIEQTINSNSNFSIQILDYIIKNEDLNFVTFYYKLSAKPTNANFNLKNSKSKRMDFVYFKTIFFNGNNNQKNVKELSWQEFDNIAIKNGSTSNDAKTFLESKFYKSFFNSIFGLKYDIPNSYPYIRYTPDTTNTILQSTFSMFELAKQVVGEKMENALNWDEVGIIYPLGTIVPDTNPETQNLTRYKKTVILPYSEYEQNNNRENKDLDLICIPFSLPIDWSTRERYLINIHKKNIDYKYFEINDKKYFEFYIKNIDFFDLNNSKSTDLNINKKLYIDVTDWNLNNI